MLKTKILIFLFVLLANSLYPQQKEWFVDTVFSSLSFEVGQVFFSKVQGEFTEYDAVILMNENDISDTQVWIQIEAVSIFTENDERDEHLRSDEFLWAEKFPTIYFESTKVLPKSENEFNLKGNFTLLGLTREIELNMKLDGFKQDMHNRNSADIEVTGEISKSDFGMPGTVMVGDKVLINCKIRLVEYELR